MEFVAGEKTQKSNFKNSQVKFVLLLGFLILSLNLSSEDEQMRRTNNIADGFITLGIKFVNFCIAKSFWYRRNIPYMETETSKSIRSWMFWIIFTNSIWRIQYL